MGVDDLKWMDDMWEVPDADLSTQEVVTPSRQPRFSNSDYILLEGNRVWENAKSDFKGRYPVTAVDPHAALKAIGMAYSFGKCTKYLVESTRDYMVGRKVQQIDHIELNLIRAKLKRELPEGAQVMLKIDWDMSTICNPHMTKITIVPAGTKYMPPLIDLEKEVIYSVKTPDEPTLFAAPSLDTQQAINNCLADMQNCADSYFKEVANVIKSTQRLADKMAWDVVHKLPNEKPAPPFKMPLDDIIIPVAKEAEKISAKPADSMFPWDSWFSGGADGGDGSAGVDVGVAAVVDGTATNEAVYPQAMSQPLMELPVRPQSVSTQSDKAWALYRENLVRALNLETTVANRLSERFANGASVMANFRPGPLGHYTMDANTLLALDGKALPLRADWPRTNALHAMLEASPESAAFYARSLSQGWDKVKLPLLSALCGFSRDRDAPISRGEIVAFSDPMHPDGGSVGVVIDADMKGGLGRMLAVGGASKTYRVVQGSQGELIWRWMPAPMMTIDPRSRIGRFWGRGLAAYRRTLIGHDAADNIWRAIFSAAPRAPRDLEAFLDMYATELLPITDKSPIVPGAIVLSDTPGDFAVAATPFSLYGRKLEVDGIRNLTFDVDRFRPTIIWYPHL